LLVKLVDLPSTDLFGGALAKINKAADSPHCGTA
jgi:hypothetical protein